MPRTQQTVVLGNDAPSLVVESLRTSTADAQFQCSLAVVEERPVLSQKVLSIQLKYSEILYITSVRPWIGMAANRYVCYIDGLLLNFHLIGTINNTILLHSIMTIFVITRVKLLIIKLTLVLTRRA